MNDKSKELNQIYCKRTQKTTQFFHWLLLTVNFKYIEQNNTYSLEHMVVENMLLFKINYKNVSSEWTVTISEQVRTKQNIAFHMCNT